MPTATTEPTPATLPTPRKVRLTDLTPNLLAPEIAGMPRPVREAAAKARAAWDAYQRELIAYREAEQDAKEAPALDEQADARALERGDDLPEPSAPAKRKVLGERNRRKLAAEQNVRQALYEQAAAMRESYGTWTASQRERVAKRAAAIAELIRRVRDEFAGLRDEQAVLTALEGFNGSPDDWHYSVPRPDREERRREKAESEVRSMRADALIPRDPYALTAALVVLAEKEST